MKNININSVNNVISYYENDNTIETVINLVRNHPKQDDTLDYVLDGTASVCENFEYVFTCEEFLEFVTTSEEKDLYKAIQDAKQLLKDNGYYVGNLWCVDDIKSKFKCNNDMAQYILDKSLTNEATYEQIWFSIDTFGDMEGLTRISEEEKK